MVGKKNQTRGYLRGNVGEGVLERYLWELWWHLEDVLAPKDVHICQNSSNGTFACYWMQIFPQKQKSEYGTHNNDQHWVEMGWKCVGVYNLSKHTLTEWIDGLKGTEVYYQV